MKLFIVFFMLVCAVFASVNINNADTKSFQSLIGVGKKKAQAIIKYRKLHGCFVSVDALTLVKGIGAKTLEKNRSQLVLGKCHK